MASNNPEESFAYLRDFGTRFPDSLYAHDALISYARALLATNRSSEAIRLLEAHRAPASAETEYFLGKAYVQNGQGRDWGRGLAACLLQLRDQLHRRQRRCRSEEDSRGGFASAGRPTPSI